MRRALVPVLLCVLATPLVAAAAPGPAVEDPRATDPVAVADATPRMLTVGGVADEGYNGTTLDWPVAFGADGSALDGRFAQYAVRERIGSAGDEAAVRAAFDRTADGIAARLASLRTREVAAVRTYATGTIGERTLLARLGTVHAEASALRPTIESLVALAPDDERTRRAFTLLHRASSLTGPLRAELAAGLEGAPDAASVHVEASTAGVTLARVVDAPDGPSYVRETVRFDNLEDGSTTSFASANALYDYLTERYPWATANSVSLGMEFPGAVHQFDLDYRGGTLRAFVDGSSRRVYREVHRMDAARIPVDTSHSASADGLSVTVNRTFAGGPLRVAVADTTGAPGNATVAVGSRTAGWTGEDGVLWTVAPHGAVNVTATASGETVAVELGA